jgi:hypothetical protein
MYHGVIITDSFMYAIKRFLAFIILAITLGISSANAATSKMIGDWKVVKSSFEEQSYCFAYTTPFRTKGLIEERNDPYLILVNKGKNAVTLGVAPGFLINGDQGVTVGLNNKEYLLNVKLDENAWTYSENQDASIINDMIIDAEILQTRSYTSDVKPAVDYYSLKGIQTVLKFLSSNCQEIQTASK